MKVFNLLNKILLILFFTIELTLLLAGTISVVSDIKYDMNIISRNYFIKENNIQVFNTYKHPKEIFSENSYKFTNINLTDKELENLCNSSKLSFSIQEIFQAKDNVGNVFPVILIVNNNPFLKKDNLSKKLSVYVEEDMNITLNTNLTLSVYDEITKGAKKIPIKDITVTKELSLDSLQLNPRWKGSVIVNCDLETLQYFLKDIPFEFIGTEMMLPNPSKESIDSLINLGNKSNVIIFPEHTYGLESILMGGFTGIFFISSIIAFIFIQNNIISSTFERKNKEIVLHLVIGASKKNLFIDILTQLASVLFIPLIVSVFILNMMNLMVLDILIVVLFLYVISIFFIIYKSIKSLGIYNNNFFYERNLYE